MASFLVNQIKQPLTEQLDKAKVAAPALVDTTTAKASKAVTESSTDAIALFTRVYVDLAARLATWLPTTKPAVMAKIDAAVAWAKAKIKAL